MPNPALTRLALLAAPLALVGCATATDAITPLSGSSWRLVEMQSMDDSQGITRPDNRDRYTIEFGAEGTAFMKLDCNNGRAPWTAARTGLTSGSLQFGPIASTMAACPPGSLSERLGQQLGYVRSYLIRDGRLNMSLMADGGILVWERTGGR